MFSGPDQPGVQEPQLQQGLARPADIDHHGQSSPPARPPPAHRGHRICMYHAGMAEPNFELKTHTMMRDTNVSVCVR